MRKTPSRPAAPETPSPKRQKIMANITATLRLLGEDTTREGLERTPLRYARAMEFLTSGYGQTANEVIGHGIFKEDSHEIVIVRDIELFSLCEHHMLPFYGRAHVAYIPNGKIIGLSKIPRILDMYARRLQVQERLTAQVADEMMKLLKPQGVAVIIEANHLCMMMRGVEKQNSYTITSAMRGVFRTQSDTRKELLSLLGGMGRRI